MNVTPLPVLVAVTALGLVLTGCGADDDPLLAASVSVVAQVVDAEDRDAAWEAATGADLLARWDQLGVDGTSTDPAPADWGDEQYAAGAVEPGAEDAGADALTADTQRWATAALDRGETLRP